jgi:2-oxoglutarate ferredoxin oxidoreductase subunit beta
VLLAIPPPIPGKPKKAIKKAFEIQAKGLGTTFIEVASNCPSGWKCTPVESLNWLKDKVYPYFPLGVFKEPPAVKEEVK